jgi:molybdenum cofactor cytidylyltransferase
VTIAYGTRAVSLIENEHGVAGVRARQTSTSGARSIDFSASAVVLAAGGSTRMKGPLKQLLPWGNSSLVRYALDVVGQSHVAETVVVVGKQADAVRREIEGTDACVVFNPDWQEGRATSVRAGLSAVSQNIAAAIFVNADQPFLTAAVIDLILERYFQTLAPLIVPVYDGTTGSPVLFARPLFDELMQLHGEFGGKHVLESHRGRAELVNIADASAGIDLDTMDQYRGALVEAKAKATAEHFSTMPEPPISLYKLNPDNLLPPSHGTEDEFAGKPYFRCSWPSPWLPNSCSFATVMPCASTASTSTRR